MQTPFRNTHLCVCCISGQDSSDSQSAFVVAGCTMRSLEAKQAVKGGEKLVQKDAAREHY